MAVLEGATLPLGNRLAARAGAVLVELVIPEEAEESSSAILFFPDGRCK